jgi:uncharacterized membrane protein
MEDIKTKLKSRKLWVALVAAVLPLIAQYLGGEIALLDALQLSAGVAISYILGQGYVDAAAARLNG